MIGLSWLINRTREKVVASLRWRVFFAIMIVAGLTGLGWLIATWTVL